ncbi:hypothetical protein PICMEDRAFT_71921 [Pichia membranifaciens NRRL Y-2026]|uniref:Uncharacterized protein n=1 Tax=Pichia membranifaciens NRRL Y-2026 TaxID=763406 RepID=A0A1E3NP85_9ASCO|nr:hypothetical protein PICMEDRAFT_71921 [Pichia membranifaciens NRRL Y-2026]ODQ47911.1 hypothetical protein PICMEDRAFT_71921 [Pichia membranifaciens NRRL Y-2026]
MWENKLVKASQSIVRCFSLSSRKCLFDKSPPKIPMISPLLNHRMLGKSHFMSTVDEETIIELLQNISEIPVSVSEVKYVNFADLPHSKRLPTLPKDLSEKSIVDYVNKLVQYRYPRSFTNQIGEALLEIVLSSPELLTKKHYLSIILFYHFHTNHKVGLQVLNLMIANTQIRQDIDFDNVLMSPTVRPPVYRQIIERLDTLKGKDFAANTNTWYYLFNVFKNPEPKIKMLELMGEYKVSLKPVLGSLSPIIEYFTPEQLTDLYQSEGCFLENGEIDPVLVNQLVACYLKDSRVDEVWSMIQNNSDLEKFITPGLFVVFANHFLKNNQLAFAIAFADYLQKNYKVKTTPILTSMILNVYLKDCPFFDRWLSLVRIFMPGVKRYHVFLNTKTISNLNDYCSLYKISNDFDVMEGQDFTTMKAIYSDLVWNDKPTFELSENSPDFIKTAKFIGQSQ